MNVRKILREYSLLVLLLLLFLLCIPSSFAGGVGRAMDPLLQEEYCKNFTYGNKDQEFFSPGFPRDYPPGIKCFRTISADYGYFVRVDFRDYFNIEPPTNEGNCDYDYLEVSLDWKILELQNFHQKYFILKLYNKIISSSSGKNIGEHLLYFYFSNRK